MVGLMLAGRSPHGERGLKCRTDVEQHRKESRSPHGERGLKCRRVLLSCQPL